MKRNELEGLLPDVFRRTARPGSVLAALLDVMEAYHAPSEEILGTLDSFFDPYRTPDDFVPYLAGWVDLLRFLDDAPEGSITDGVTFAGGTGRLRELIAAAAHLTRWRGTARGLVLFLETATGVPGFVIEEDVPGPDGRPLPFHLRVVAPAAAQPAAILIRQIVQMEKPAYVTFELVFGADWERITVNGFGERIERMMWSAQAMLALWPSRGTDYCQRGWDRVPPAGNGLNG